MYGLVYIIKGGRVNVKTVCQLVGTDGNVFAIVGNVVKTLKKAGLKEQANEFTERAFNSKGYDEVLRLTMEYVEVI